MTITYDPRLRHIIAGAVGRLQAEMAQTAPVMARQVAGWITSLAGTARPEDYFEHPLAFPALLLPWWLAEALQPEQIDMAFQADLAYSTINGYYFIRLIDNLMDGQATVELKLLPALTFFHTQFQAAYHRYFEVDHPFWSTFTTVWVGAAEAALKDAHLADIDLDQFMAVAAQKVSAAKIPLAAVCYRNQRPDLIEPWSRFVDLFGGWHQLLNDLFDWQQDLQRGLRTYFLAEAERRGYSSSSAIAVWVVQEGFQWGIDTLRTWMVELKELAGDLYSPLLPAYLDEREAMLLEQQAAVAPGLAQAAKILALLEGG